MQAARKLDRKESGCWGGKQRSGGESSRTYARSVTLGSSPGSCGGAGGLGEVAFQVEHQSVGKGLIGKLHSHLVGVPQGGTRPEFLGVSGKLQGDDVVALRSGGEKRKNPKLVLDQDRKLHLLLNYPVSLNAHRICDPPEGMTSRLT